MEDQTVGFFECEPECWLVVGFRNDPPRALGPTAQRPDLFAHRPTGQGMVDAVKYLYYRFVATNGTVERLLAGHDGEGWEHIETVRVFVTP